MPISHLKVSTKLDSSDPTIIQPSDWNAEHTFSGTSAGILYAESNVAPIASVPAGDGFNYYLRRRANGSSAKEEFYFDRPKFVCASDFTYSIVIPDQPLAPLTLTAITIAPVPMGLNASLPNQYVTVRDVISVYPEVCLIEGGTAVGGASSGTIVIRTSQPHSSDYIIESATAGIQEAMSYLPAYGGTVIVDQGSATIYGPITIDRNGLSIYGLNTLLMGYTATLNGPMFKFIGGRNNILQGLQIASDNRDSGQTCVEISNQEIISLRDIKIHDYFNPIKINSCTVGMFEGMSITQCGNAGQAIFIQAGNAIEFSNCWIDVNNGAAEGIYIRNVDNLKLSNVSVVRASHGLSLVPIASGSITGLSISNSSFSACLNEGIFIESMFANSVTYGIIFTNTGILNNQKSGINIKSLTSVVHNISFVGCRVKGNLQNGIMISGANSKYIALSANQIIDNAIDLGISWYGVYSLDSTLSMYSNNIIGCGDLTAARYKACIYFGPGSNVIATDNVFYGFTGASGIESNV